MKIIIAIILVIILFSILATLIPFAGILLVFGGAIYVVLMILQAISKATGHYHYDGIDIEFNNKQIKNDEEFRYFNDWGLIKNGVKVPHIIVKYFGGHSNIDKHGDFYNKDFYFYVNAHNVLFMLTVNFVNKEAFWALRNQELEYYTLSPDKTMIIINTLEGKIRETIHLSSSAYDVMLKNYPTKDLECIKQKEVL